MEAIILAGGFGTRLKSVVSNVPKPMAPVLGKPFLHYLLIHLKKFGFKKVYQSLFFRSEVIVNYFGNSYLGIDLEYVIDKEALGTGGAIKNILNNHYINDDCFIINGDTFFELDYKQLYKLHKQCKSRVSMAVKYLPNCERYGRVLFDNSQTIKSFQEKGQIREGYINGGVYIFNPKILNDYDLNSKFSFENDFLANYLLELNIKAVNFNNYFIDIGVPEDYLKFIELQKKELTVNS